MGFTILAIVSILLIIGSRAASKKISRYIAQNDSDKAHKDFFQSILAGSASELESEAQVQQLKRVSEELTRRREVRKQIERDLDIEM